jgi:hypothetical protein
MSNELKLQDEESGMAYDKDKVDDAGRPCCFRPSITAESYGQMLVQMPIENYQWLCCGYS